MNAPLFPPQYCAPASYYAAMARHDEAVIADGLRFDKRFKSTHRCMIPGNHGTITLTVPVAKPHGAEATWADAIVSDHGDWWNEHITALESTYGRSPYFEFYADDFRHIICREAAGRRLVDFNADIDRLIRRLLGITTRVEHSHEAVGSDSLYRPGDYAIPRYWQVRPTDEATRALISVLDMLFCLGPEALPLLLAHESNP